MRRLLAVAMVSACSIGLDRVPSNLAPGQRVECSDSYIVPIIDATTAAAATGATLYFALHKETCGSNGYGADFGCGSERLLAVPTAVIAVLWGLASTEGFATVRDCRRARARQAQP